MPDPRPEPFPVALAWRLAAIAAVGAAVAVVSARVTDPDFAWLQFADRDLARAAGLEGGLPVEGAEISHGSGVRIPGAATYALFRGLQALGPAPDAVWRSTVLLDALAAVALGAWVARRHGRTSGALALGLAATATATASTLSSLWNPSLLPPFAAALWVATLAGVRGRRAGTLPTLLLAGAVGAQLHLSVIPLLLAAVVAVLVTRPVGLVRGLGLGLALAVLAYAPFLAADAPDGFPRLRALLQVAPPPDQAADPRGVLAFLLGPTPPFVPSRVLAPALVAGIGAAVVVLDGVLALAAGAAALRRDDDGRVARTTLALVAVAVVAALGSGVDPSRPGTGRHLLVVAPGLAVLGALGLHAARRRLPAAASVGLALLVAVGLGARGASLVLGHREQSTSPLAYQELRARIDAVAVAAGLDVTEVAARTAFVPAAPGDWRAAVAWVYPAWLAGGRLPGPRPGPCVAVLLPGRDVPDDAVRLDRAFRGRRKGAPERLTELPDRTRIVRWTVDGPCPTSFGDPWLAGPDDVLPVPPAGTAVPLPTDGARRAWAVGLPPGDDGRAVPALRVEVTAGAVRLDARELRGDSAGFFPSGPLRDVTLLVGDPPYGAVVLADELGPTGLVTPLVARLPAPVPPEAPLWLSLRPKDVAPPIEVPLPAVTPSTPPRSPRTSPRRRCRPADRRPRTAR